VAAVAKGSSLRVQQPYDWPASQDSIDPKNLANGQRQTPVHRPVSNIDAAMDNPPTKVSLALPS
jgi:hypothetical protein